MENAATQFFTALSGNGGSISATAQSFNVADGLPAGVSAPFRAVIAAAGASTGENVVVGGVVGTAWSAVQRGVETALGAPAATTHNDGDTVAIVLTGAGIFQLGLHHGPASRTNARGNFR